MSCKAFFSLLGRKRIKNMLLLLPVMLVGSLLEMLGMGIIVSVCTLLVNDRWFYENPAVLRVCSLLHLQQGNDMIAAILLALFGLYIFKALYLAWESYVVAKFVRTTRCEVSDRLFRRIVRAPYPFFVRHGTAEIQNLLGRDADQFGIGLNSCMQLLLDGLVALGMCVFLMIVEPTMTLFLAIGIALLLLLTRLVLNPIIQRASQRQRMAVRARWTWLHQAVAGIKDVRIGRHEGFFSAHFEDTNEAFARTEYLKQFWTKLPVLCIETIVVLSVLCYLLFLALRGEELSLYMPSLSALALAAIRLLPACNGINSSLTQIGYVKPSVYAICEAMEETKTGSSCLERPQKGIEFSQGISLHDVSYAYEGGAEAVLEHVDMDIPAGAAVGIVGPSGAGKTTLLDILLGLLVPEHGQVCIDGIPISECYESYLQRVAYVPQTTFLLDDSVRGNVALGQEPGQIDDGRVWTALERAALEGMVRALPTGLDTQVGEGGIRFSGGERQRLGLARAMYRNPSVIVFDEATSALDLDTEAEVLQSIARLKGKKTLIVVSHRPSAIDHCDRVYRVQDRAVRREK